MQEENKVLKAISKACLSSAIPISKLPAILKLPYQTIYHAIMRNKDKGLFAIEKIDSINFVRSLTVPGNIDLIKRTQKSNSCKFEYPHDIPKRCSTERKHSIRKACRKIDIRAFRDEAIQDFTEYVRRIKRKKLVLIPNPALDLCGEAIYKDYETRFTSNSRKVKNLKNYEYAWEAATVRYKTGMMITLTTDPKKQNSLWDANRKIGKNLNKLLSFIQRRKGFRPEYINVFEYQKNGRIHIHLMLFGLKWLMPKDELSALWSKYEQGEIVDFLSVRNDGNGWIWAKQKPHDCTVETPADYLKKYLKKALFDPEKLFQYWIYNNRFFSNARVLNAVHDRPVPLGFYIYIGCIDEEPNEEYEFIPGELLQEEIDDIELGIYTIADALEAHRNREKNT